MKRALIPTLGALAAIVTLSCTASDEPEQSVLLVVPEDSSADLEYMLENEAGVMKSLLEQAGYGVVVASATGQPFVAGEQTLVPDVRIADVNGDEIAGIIMPCMATAAERAQPAELTPLVQHVVAQGKPVAAQFGGIQTLAGTGVLNGKKVSYIEEFVEAATLFEEAEYSGTHAVVTDGNIITSGVCPYMAMEGDYEDGTTALTQALIAQLGADH